MNRSVKWRSIFRALTLLCLLFGASQALAADPTTAAKKLWSFKPDGGFIDDPTAFSEDGSRFAFIHTDSANYLKIIVVNTTDFAKEREINVTPASRQPRGLFFTDDGKKIIYSSSDEDKGLWQAEIIDLAAGKSVKKLGPANNIELVKYKGDQVLSFITSRADNKGNTIMQIAVQRVKDFKRIGGGSFVVQGDGEIKGRDMRIFYWEPGHLSFVAMKKGAYDKKRDIRLPQTAIRYDVLGKQETWSSEPQDIVKWTKVMNMRASHQGQFKFLDVSEDLKKLMFADQQNEPVAVNTPVKWNLYEPKSLRQWESPDGQTLFCSLTIDPVNEQALKIKKAQEERMDLYQVTGTDKEPLLSLVGQVPTKQHGFAWTLSDKHFSYLRKHKGFSRGGAEIEIYPRAATSK